MYATGCDAAAPPPRQPRPDAPWCCTREGLGGSSVASAPATTAAGRALSPDARHTREVAGGAIVGERCQESPDATYPIITGVKRNRTGGAPDFRIGVRPQRAKMRISTRRLRGSPATGSFGKSGLCSPRPRAASRNGDTPWVSTR